MSPLSGRQEFVAAGEDSKRSRPGLRREDVTSGYGTRGSNLAVRRRLSLSNWDDVLAARREVSLATANRSVGGTRAIRIRSKRRRRLLRHADAASMQGRPEKCLPLFPQSSPYRRARPRGASAI